MIRKEAHIEQITKEEFKVASELIVDLLPQIEDFMDKGIDYKAFISEKKKQRFAKKEADTKEMTVQEKEQFEVDSVFK